MLSLVKMRAEKGMQKPQLRIISFVDQFHVRETAYPKLEKARTLILSEFCAISFAAYLTDCIISFRYFASGVRRAKKIPDDDNIVPASRELPTVSILLFMYTQHTHISG